MCPCWWDLLPDSPPPIIQFPFFPIFAQLCFHVTRCLLPETQNSLSRWMLPHLRCPAVGVAPLPAWLRPCLCSSPAFLLISAPCLTSDSVYFTGCNQFQLSSVRLGGVRGVCAGQAAGEQQGILAVTENASAWYTIP